MRQLLVATGVVLLAGCGGAAVQGEVHVGPGEDGLAVVALIWQAPNDVVDPSTLVTLGQLVVGTATAQGGTFDYTFHSLEKGTYVVGATFVDEEGNFTGPLTVNLDTPLRLDPASDKSSAATQDVFLAKSAPDEATLRGTLHLAPELANESTTLFVFDRGLEVAGAKVLVSSPAPAGTDVPYALFNVPASASCGYPTPGAPVEKNEPAPTTPCDLHVVAIADSVDDTDGSKATYAFSPSNPVTTTAGKETQGVDLWVGRQSPDLGSISGTVTFNATLPSLALQLLLLTPDAGASPPDAGPASDLEALVEVPVASVASADFTIPSVRNGTHFLAAVLSTTDPDGTVLTASRIYEVDGKDKPVAVSSDAKDVAGLEFPLGVGRVSGTITVRNAPDKLGAAAVFALPPADFVPGGFSPDTQREAVVGVKGDGAYPYVVFGLEDGDYTMQLIPDSNGDGDLNDEYQAGQIFNGDPLKVTIAGGGRAASDFQLAFPP